MNVGSQPQSNFTVGASYNGASSGSMIATYNGTLAPLASDTITFPAFTLQPGTYNVNAYPMLVTDTAKSNDTSGFLSFIVKQAVPIPTTHSDTVCAGGNAFLFVDALQNTQYHWYSSITGGTLVNIGNTLSFPGLTQDTTMYVASFQSGCQSARTPISAAIGQPPVVNLPGDTSFCESIPLLLNAGNPGAKYLWSTGDTTQSIVIINASGNYWVEVDRYCITSDSVTVNIAPIPLASGISYVRMNNTYHFTASSHQHVNEYTWLFGDGTQESGIAPLPPGLIEATHTYSLGINAQSTVGLVVNNNCGTDTVLRFVPTNVTDLTEAEHEIKVYPNPAKDQLNVEIEDEEIQLLYLVDVQGKAIKTFDAKASRVVVPTNDVATGTYILRIKTDQNLYHRPVSFIR